LRSPGTVKSVVSKQRPSGPPHLDLQQLAQAAAEARPQLRLPREDFVRYLAARLPARADAATASLPFAGDLYLAFGCAQGTPAALSAFQAEIMPEVDAVLRRFGDRQAAADDLRQMLYEKLLVGGAGQEPKIGEYAGRGPLRAWARVVATRVALNVLRQGSPEVPSPDFLLNAATAPGVDPELDFLRRTQGHHLRRAFEHAMKTLTPERRVLLRLHFVDGLTTEQIGKLHGKHRVTVLRRIEQVLGDVRLQTRRFIERDLDCGRGTAHSIVKAGLGADLDINLRRYLTEPALAADADSSEPSHDPRQAGAPGR
jgi:RNA polymerase sigma-70 factor, ECF subfamily